MGKASRPQWVLLCLRPVLGAEGTGMTPTLADGASDSRCNVCFRDSLWGEDVLPAQPRDAPPLPQHLGGGGGALTSHLPGSPAQHLCEAHKASPIQGSKLLRPLITTLVV